MAITWSNTDGNGSVKAVCTTGTETFAKAATDGAFLGNAGAVDVYVEADASQTLSGGGTLQAWIYNRLSGNWARAADFDLTVPAGASGNRSSAFAGLSAGKGIPVISKCDRIAFVPQSVAVSSGGCTVYLNCYAARRGL